MSAAITVLARWQPAPGAFNEVWELAAQMRRQSLEEPGCLGYEAYQSAGEERSLLLVERYRDEAALEAHKQSAHYRSLVVERVLPLLAERKVDLLRAHAPL